MILVIVFGIICLLLWWKYIPRFVRRAFAILSVILMAGCSTPMIINDNDPDGWQCDRSSVINQITAAIHCAN